MELLTIGQASKECGISIRMLRYYEQIGLIESNRKGDGAYRVYDESTVNKLKQIIVLRKLRVPVKQIIEILGNPNAAVIVDIFKQNIDELDDEIATLATIKSILSRFVEKLNETAHIKIGLDFTTDEAVLSAMETLSFTKNHVKEDVTMSDLNKADEKLNKLTDKDVRIVYLPPSYVAAYQYEGDEPENHVGEIMNKFVKGTNLPQIKPDVRHYGFNAPDATDETSRHGYEMWVTIPPDMDVPAPLTKKYFEGGLYGAYMMNFPEFEKWQWMFQWIGDSEKYEYRGDTSKGTDNMHGLMEEMLNYYNCATSTAPTQLDLLMPIKEKEA